MDTKIEEAWVKAAAAVTAAAIAYQDAVSAADESPKGRRALESTAQTLLLAVSLENNLAKTLDRGSNNFIVTWGNERADVWIRLPSIKLGNS